MLSGEASVRAWCALSTADAALQVENVHVSRRHAVVSVTAAAGPALTWTDASKFGSFLGERRMEPDTPISLNDALLASPEGVTLHLGAPFIGASVRCVLTRCESSASSGATIASRSVV